MFNTTTQHKKLMFIAFLFFLMIPYSCSDNKEEKEDVYQIQMDIDNEEGTVDISNSKEDLFLGEETQLTAVPNEGFVFDHWELPGAIVSTENPLNYTVGEDNSIKVFFKVEEVQNNYQLSFSYSFNQGYIVLNPSKEYYDKGEEVEVSAFAVEGYIFTGWRNMEGNASVITVIMNEDTHLEPVFEKDEVIDSKPYLSIEGLRVKIDEQYYWSFEVEFVPVSSKEADAKLMVNSKAEVALTDGKASFKSADIDPGVKISFSIEHTSIANSEIYELKVPQSFGRSEQTLFENIDGDTYTFSWEENGSDAYVLNRKVANFSVMMDMGTGNTFYNESPLEQTKGQLLNNPYVQVPMSYFAVSISPVNMLGELKGFSSNSRICLTGQSTNWLSNSTKTADYWRID